MSENYDEPDEEFNATHAYFIGPKGANLPDFRANINTILDELLEARQSYYPEDKVSAPENFSVQLTDSVKLRNSSPSKSGVRTSS